MPVVTNLLGPCAWRNHLHLSFEAIGYGHGTVFEGGGPLCVMILWLSQGRAASTAVVALPVCAPLSIPLVSWQTLLCEDHSGGGHLDRKQTHAISGYMSSC